MDYTSICHECVDGHKEISWIIVCNGSNVSVGRHCTIAESVKLSIVSFCSNYHFHDYEGQYQNQKSITKHGNSFYIFQNGKNKMASEGIS